MLKNILKTYDPVMCTVPGIDAFEWHKVTDTALMDTGTRKQARTHVKLIIRLNHTPTPAEKQSIKDMVIAELEEYGAPTVYANATNIQLQYTHDSTAGNDIDIYYEVIWEQNV